MSIAPLLTTQTCISNFQQTMDEAEPFQNAAISTVVLGMGLCGLGLNDFIVLSKAGMKKLMGRGITFKKVDLLYLMFNGCLKISCGTTVIIYGYQAKPYLWNSTVQNKCLSLAEQTQNINTLACNDICLSIMQLPAVRKVFFAPIILGSLNIAVSLIAAIYDVKNIYAKFRKNNNEELVLISKNYRPKKIRIRLLSNIFQIILSGLIIYLFCSNVMVNQSNIYGEPKELPQGIADKCFQLCS